MKIKAKTRISNLHRKTSSIQKKKEHLKKPEFIKLDNFSRASGGFAGSGNLHRDENKKPSTKSKLIIGNVAKSVPITPHKTRTGKVYSRLSTIFAHKISQQLPITPLSKKCLKESNACSPTNVPSYEEPVEQAKSVPIVINSLFSCNSLNIFALVTEEEINRTIEKVPNLDDISEPAALVSFNSTFNESICVAKDDQVKMIEEKVESSCNLETGDEKSKHNDLKNTEGGGDADILSRDGEKAVENLPEKLSEPLPPRLPKLPDINFNFDSVKTSSTSPLRLPSISPESSPLIPRMNPLKICQQFKGFNSVLFEPPVSTVSDETTKSDLMEEVENVQPSDNLTNGDDVAESLKCNTSVENLPEPSDVSPMLSKEPQNHDSVTYRPSSSSPPASLDDSIICLSPVPASTSTSSFKDENQTESLLELSTQYEPPKKKGRGRPRKSIAPKKFPNKTATPSPKKSPVKPATPSPKKSPDENAIPSPKKSPAVDSDEEIIEPEKYVVTEPEQHVAEPSSSLEVINGKVYTTIKRPKYGKKGIPLTVEVDSSLLVEPKESCIKKAKNEAWNGKKHFRWADWTKDNELINVREFESDEKYSFRKSTKSRRYSDPYGEDE
uniref:Uncharacterized protein n=1 Tax=Panagrolaimus sp. ES5 TaxID=591445 RepID=A0AC34FWB3_9BILA